MPDVTILVHDSIIRSGAQPLSLNLVAAGGGVGAIELRDVSINTAGGQHRAARRERPCRRRCPAAGFTPDTFQLATGYDPAQQGRGLQVDRAEGWHQPATRPASTWAAAALLRLPEAWTRPSSSTAPMRR